MNRKKIALQKARDIKNNKNTDSPFIYFVSEDCVLTKESKKIYREYCYDIKNDCLID